MIKLRNLSKFYYSKGIIASGLTRINLDLDVGEFVVITGESGSGKSTLINVISGLDTYEEGEMYIDGEETSHYTIEDFENYRKRYIANIFQNFNLVTSYTVYQNVELILLIEGKKSADVKDTVNEIIDKVGLSEYRNTKVSKLSGGQKQRVAIARALAKDTPIIVADEPTGNLDSESAAVVVRLLRELSKDKLVIVVTHNYDQFEEVATRRIKLNDGKLNEDDKLKPIEVVENVKAVDFGIIKPISKLKLGFRNTFNLIPKFLLSLFVFFFLVVSVAGQYTSFKAQNDAFGNMGINSFFNNMSDSRVVVKKQDNSAMTEEDFTKLAKIKNVKSLFKSDVIMDTSLYIEGVNYVSNGFPASKDNMPSKSKLSYGKFPEAEDEVLISYFMEDGSIDYKKAVGETVNIILDDGKKIPCKIAGFAKVDIEGVVFNISDTVYMSDSLIAQLKDYAVRNFTQTELNINGKIVPSSMESLSINSNENVPEGMMFVPEDVNNMYENGSAKWKKISVNIKNIYFEDSRSLTVSNSYNKTTYKKLLGLEDEFDSVSGKIYINPNDYSALYNKPDYQSSILLKDSKLIDETIKDIEEAGYYGIPLKKAKTSIGELTILNIVRIPFVVIIVLAIFFICYFVIKLILKSRDVYFAILRMLGLDMKNLKRILDIEMLTIIHIAYGIFLALAYMINKGIIQSDTLRDTLSYFAPHDYVILYAVVIVMAYIISRKFAKSLFKKSAMSSYREGV